MSHGALGIDPFDCYPGCLCLLSPRVFLTEPHIDHHQRQGCKAIRHIDNYYHVRDDGWIGKFARAWRGAVRFTLVATVPTDWPTKIRLHLQSNYTVPRRQLGKQTNCRRGHRGRRRGRRSATALCGSAGVITACRAAAGLAPLHDTVRLIMGHPIRYDRPNPIRLKKSRSDHGSRNPIIRSNSLEKTSI